MSALWSCVGGGALLYIAGTAIVLATWDSLFTITDPYAEADGNGFAFGLMVGALLASLGGALVVVGLIGFGVKLGREASRK